jgi:BA14K-like protein
MTAAAVGASLFLAMAPAQAQHWHGGHGGWHGGGWRGGGWGGAAAGFAAGAIVGSAVGAGGYYYGPYGYGYGGGYGPDYAYGPGYAYGPAYDDSYAYDDSGYADGGAAMASGNDASYCAQRYRSYNPRTGTYLGFDGQRHPCP